MNDFLSWFMHLLRLYSDTGCGSHYKHHTKLEKKGS